ncbi:MAG: sodium:calcium antiporter [Pirellulales bacterium]|nr:sodium:calcium antiporter [Pirellulales bacterium]
MIDALTSVLGEEALHDFYQARGAAALAGLLAGLLFLLGKAADKLVGEAVVVSERSGLPKVVIGATIVSLGTTSPEAAVSVLAALQGDPGLALGNAVGSIICDTGLILGIACLVAPPVLPRRIVNRQGWLQFGAALLLVALCWPIGGSPLVDGGRLSQRAGFLLVGLLVGYLWLNVRWARQSDPEEIAAKLEAIEQESGDLASPLPAVVAKLLAAVGMVVLASHLLIPAISVAAERLGVPKAIVAASLVAFGTSLPELVTAITASLRGHGDLAVGNVIGADILNVLFVAGLAAAATPAGLVATPEFFRVLFPAMIGLLVVFRVGVLTSGERLKRGFGLVLLLAYVGAMIASYATIAPGE